MSTGQLHAAGMDKDGIDRRVAAGRLHPIRRGVYAVGHRRLGPRGPLWAAVLACGEGDAVSHRAAAWAWGIREGLPPVTVDVLTVGESRSRKGIRVHRSRSIDVRDTTTLDGLPITTPARTLLDLAAIRSVHLPSAIRRAEIQRVFDGRAIADLLDRAPHHPGAKRLRTALAATQEPDITQSELEARFLEIVRGLGLPEPEKQYPINGRLLDFYWPHRRLAVEVDDRGTHLTATAFEDDRVRDADLKVLGIDTIRFTRRKVLYDRPYVERTITALASSRTTSPPIRTPCAAPS